MVAMMDLSLANVKRLMIDLDEVIFESHISAMVCQPFGIYLVSRVGHLVVPPMEIRTISGLPT